MLFIEIAAVLFIAYIAFKVGMLIVVAAFGWLFSRDEKKVTVIEKSIPQYSYSDSAYGGVVKNW